MSNVKTAPLDPSELALIEERSSRSVRTAADYHRFCDAAIDDVPRLLATVRELTAKLDAIGVDACDFRCLCGAKIDLSDEDGMVCQGDYECPECDRPLEAEDVTVRARITWKDVAS